MKYGITITNELKGKLKYTDTGYCKVPSQNFVREPETNHEKPHSR